MILAAGAFVAGAVAAIGITFAILRWLFGDLRLLS